jgi:FAD:protein FMN transferase
MKKRNSIVLGMICILAFAVIAWIRLGDTPQLSQATVFLMDTSVTVKVYAPASAHGEKIIEKAFDEARRIEKILDARKGNGEVRQINAGAPGKWWIISPELRTVLERAKYLNRITNGAFDPTIAAVKWLWRFDEGGHVPSADELKQALGTVGFERITVRGDSLNIGSAGTQLDLGGIAGGYVVDRMVEFLHKNGCTSALIDDGGDIYTFGVKPGGKPWTIGIRNPSTGKTIMVDHMSLPSVTTSGDYERYFESGGVRYHHILDPKTGYPARGCTSVTVWAVSTIDADALATSLFVLGPDAGLKLAEELPEVEALFFYYADNGTLKYVMTSGVRGKVAI